MRGRNHWLVVWKIDCWADTPEQAAKQARDIQLDHESTATVFEVINQYDKREYRVDLEELDG